MRIAIYIANIPASEGGGYTFQDTICNALREYKGHHDLFVVTNQCNQNNCHCLSLSEFNQLNLCKDRYRSSRFWHRLYQHLLFPLRPHPFTCSWNNMLKEYHIECIWYPRWVSVPRHIDNSIPYILTVWDVDYCNYPWFPEFCRKVGAGDEWAKRDHIYRNILPRAARIITGTEAGKNEICHYHAVNLNNVFVNPMPIDLTRCNKGCNSDSQSVLQKMGITTEYFLYPAQFWAHKNHANILKALDLLVNKLHLHVHIVFCGTDHGNKQYIKSLSTRLNLQNNVSFLGFVKEDDLMILYRNATALLYASLGGPDNIPPLEAFALNCPVLAHDTPGSREQLGDAALYFDGTAPVTIAAAVKQCLDNVSIRQVLIERGCYQLKGRTGKDYIDRMDQVFDNVASLRYNWLS